MNTHIMKSELAQGAARCTTSKVIAAFITTTCIVTSTQSFAEQDGRSGRAGNTTRACTSCHTAGAAVPTVAFTSPATSVAPGSTTNYTVTITAGAGGPAATAGIDVAVSAGTLSTTDAGAKLSDATTAGGVAGEIVQSAPKTMTAGTASFTFAWTAPTTPGTATVYVAGMTTDGVLDDQGDAVTLITLPVTIAGTATNQAPVARITGPTTTAAGVTVTFSGTGSTDPDGTIATYDWNFGDGTAGSGATVTKSFAVGTWAVQLTVTDNLGLTNTAMMPVTVSAAGTNVPPTANAGGPYSGTVGTAIAFNGAGSTDSDGTISSYAWNFGDGSTPGTGVTTSYAYTTAGTYTATLTVTDNAGATATSTAAVTITAAGTGTPPPATTTGQAEYVADCESCHGVNGVGGPDGDVVGASVEDIVEAIADEPAMASLSTLPQEHIDAIAIFLTEPDDDDDAAATDGDDDDAPAAPLAPQRSDGTGSSTADTAAKANARGTGGGAIDVWLVAGLILCGARRRVLERAGGARRAA